MIKMRGFTLIELLITLIIMGLLASIAYPLYTHHVIKTRRAVAEAGLLQIAHQMERYYLQHHSYQGATLEVLSTPHFTTDGFYKFEIASTDSNYFMLHANPQSSQATGDEECGILTFDAQGTKENLGINEAGECW